MKNKIFYNFRFNFFILGLFITLITLIGCGNQGQQPQRSTNTSTIAQSTALPRAAVLPSGTQASSTTTQGGGPIQVTAAPVVANDAELNAFKEKLSRGEFGFLMTAGMIIQFSTPSGLSTGCFDNLGGPCRKGIIQLSQEYTAFNPNGATQIATGDIEAYSLEDYKNQLVQIVQSGTNFTKIDNNPLYFQFYSGNEQWGIDLRQCLLCNPVLRTDKETKTKGYRFVGVYR